MPELTKPNAQSLANLDKIAAKIGKQLQQLPIENIMDWDSRYGYSCDEAGDVTGLNLRSSKINDISFLTDFPCLIHLSLYENKISCLSPIQALTQLTYLYLGRNQISDISPLITLTKLNYLDLHYNQVADLSPLEALTQLTDLYLRYNKIVDLSPLKTLTHLKHLYIGSNPIEIPPPEIMNKGMPAIREYLKSLSIGPERKLNEVKVLLVGDGGAGKTSLFKRLKGLPFDKNERATHGVNIVVMDIKTTLPDRKEETVRTHFWDFGGQEIMHASHQFFLSKRSLYILLLDGRKDEKTEYWLKHIESFGGN
ncbi:MAG: leucine-rich repeat domain-containing protein, partial [Candidatus Aminicenantes bacterium]|nr:leucine-rich repeat domain-containing protein [Candidatus Aminicenantes bacterium]